MVTRGLVVGRFQPFHLGHLNALKEILKEVDEIIIVIGSAQYSHRLDNPFTAGERISMIRRALNEEGILPSQYWIIPVPDIHMHALWVSRVTSYTPSFDVVYSNSPLTCRLFKEAKFKVKSIPFYKRDLYSATEIRQKMIKKEKWENLVPEAVARYIKEIKGVERLQELAKTDKK